MRLASLLVLSLVPSLCLAQAAMPDTTSVTAPATSTEPGAKVVSPSHPTTVTALQSSVDHLTQTNQALLDLLKKQQGVLEDIQYDRRLQSRQIESLEERLQETLLQNQDLQNKVDKLTAAASAAPAPAPGSPPQAGTSAVAPAPAPVVATPPAPPPPPASYLPPAEASVPGAMSWHRLFTLSGTDNRSSDFFHIEGHQWRVLWHNQDKPGKAYVNTSALFLNAFPKDDTIPQKVCSKLGSGGDSTELIGPGNYYLKIEASGGAWELAVEDFH